MEERLRNSLEKRDFEQGNPEHPEAFKSPNSQWTVATLRSEIETLETICSAKDKEILLLKYQLLQSNKLIEESRDQLKRICEGFDGSDFLRPNHTIRGKIVPSSRGKDCTLLESFANASSVTLNNVLGYLQKTLNVTDIHNLPKEFEKSMKYEIKYTELLHGVCRLLDVRTSQVHHRDVLRMLDAMTKRQIDIESENGLKNEVRGKNGVAWTFH